MSTVIESKIRNKEKSTSAISKGKSRKRNDVGKICGGPKKNDYEIHLGEYPYI